MASYRKRGAHAARPVTAPFVALKRVPQKVLGRTRRRMAMWGMDLGKAHGAYR